MVYIRSKKVKGDQYLYLVKSVWDSEKSTSRQEIIKYLGKAADVTTQDIPIEYQNESKIVSFLTKFAGKNIQKNENLLKKLRTEALNALIAGDFERALSIYQEYTKQYRLEDFFENILKPVMYKVGELWKKGEISVGSEHVASNIAHKLNSVISERNSKEDNKGRVLICTPVGEEHCIGCNLIQTILQNKGFRVYNLAPSAPIESVLHFIKESEPDIILVSITIKDNIAAGQRLINKIKKESNIPILVGGQAVLETSSKFNAIKLDEPLYRLPLKIKSFL